MPYFLAPDLISLLMSILNVVETSIVFWQKSVSIGEPCSFQVVLTAPAEGAIQSLTFTSVQIFWDEHKPPIVVQHSADESAEACSRIDIGSHESSINSDVAATPTPTVQANLTWKSRGCKVFAGSIASLVPKELGVSKRF